MRHQAVQTRAVADDALYRDFPPIGGGGANLRQPMWFVDPSNVTGNASNSNTGLTAGDPLLTFGEIVERWGTNAPPLAQDTTITFLSSQPDLTDPINIFPQLLGGGASLFFKGVLTQVATDRVTTYTPRNRVAGTLDTITGTAIVDFTPFDNKLVNAETFGSVAPTLSPTLLFPIGFFFGGPFASFSGVPTQALNPIEVDITSPTQFSWSINGVVQQTNVNIAAAVVLGATGVTAHFPAGVYSAGEVMTAYTSGWFWIDDTNIGVATITAPMVEGLGIDFPAPFFVPPWKNIANGSTIKIYDIPQIYVQACNVQNNFVQNPNVINNVFFEQLFLVNPPVSFPPAFFTAETCVFQQCRMESTQLTQGKTSTGSINCMQNGGFFGGASNFYGGSLARTGTLNVGELADSLGVGLDGDVIVHSTNVVIDLGGAVIGFAFFSGPNAWIQTGYGDVFLSADDPRCWYSFVGWNQGGGLQAALWGNAVAQINNGAAFRIVEGGGITAVGSILLTPVPNIQIDGSSAAIFSTYNPATGVWTPLVAPTAANVDAFGAVINPQTNSRVCQNGDNNHAPL